MATSKVEIANMALVGLRANTINDFSDGTTEANSINVLWDMVRKSELNKHPYNFAIKRVSLPRLTDTPLFGYEYQYQLPADYIRALNLEDYSDYKIEGDKLLTNETEVNLKYIADITDISKWSAGFVDLVASRLRVELSNNLTADKNMLQLAKDLYDRKSREVKYLDAVEDTADPLGRHVSSYVRARY